MDSKQITISRVVSRDFITDFVSSIQNTFGHRLSGYEKMLDKGVAEIWKEVASRNLKIKWYRVEVTQLMNGAVAILFYGEIE